MRQRGFLPPSPSSFSLVAAATAVALSAVVQQAELAECRFVGTAPPARVGAGVACVHVLCLVCAVVL